MDKILRPFSVLAHSKPFFFKFNGGIYAYRVFYLPIFRRIEGGSESTPLPGPYGTEKSVVLKGLMNKYALNLFHNLIILI